MDALHPGSVNLSRVDFNSRSEYDSINNYKALQAAFARAGVDKPVDVARLVKARPLDNIEFMQWFKSYWDSQTGGGGGEDGGGALSGYDARARRAASKTGDVRGGGGGNGGGGAASTSSADGVAPSSQPSSSGRAHAHTPAAPVTARAPLASRENNNRLSTPSRANKAATTAGTAAGGRKAAAAAAAGPPGSASTTTATTISELTAALAEARIRAAAAERERDFYFDKLRDVELLCGAQGLLEDENGEPVAGAAAALALVERVLFAADEAGAKEVLAEAGVVAGVTGVTPPPPSSEEEGVAAAGGGGGEVAA